MSTIRLPICRRCRVPHVPDEIAERVKAGEKITVEIVSQVHGVAANVLAHGAGALNIDACRVGTTGGETHTKKAANRIFGVYAPITEPKDNGGRWPPNLLMSHSPDCRPAGTRRVKTNWTDPHSDSWGTGNGSTYCHKKPQGAVYADAEGFEEVAAWDCAEGCPIRELDAQAGVRTSGAHPNGVQGRAGAGFMQGWAGGVGPVLEASSGGASRFFPCFHFSPKASRSERNAGCGMLEEGPPPASARSNPAPGRELPLGRPRSNHHPTVKPSDLLRWLARLVTPPGGVILDPFFGSGSVGVAAVEEGFRIIGIEREPSEKGAPDYCAIARARLVHAARQPRLFAAEENGEDALEPAAPPAQLTLEDD